MQGTCLHATTFHFRKASWDLWTWHLQEPLHYWAPKRFSFPSTALSCILLTQLKTLKGGWHGPHAFRGFLTLLTSPSPLLGFLQYFFFMQKEIYLSLWHVPCLLPLWTWRQNCQGFFFLFSFFSYTMSINNSQQLLESFHRWSIIPLAHATVLIIY